MSSNFLPVNELDFFALKENLKKYLQSQSEYSDYDFEGSNFSVLLDILAYNTYINSYYLNQVGSEMFLDTAKIKESVVSHAKELNYLPKSRTSARAKVNITITAPDNPSSITIPKFFKFNTSIDSTNITFSTGSNVVVTPVSGVYLASNVEIYEGDIVTELFEVSSSTDKTFKLRSENIDTSSISVEVLDSDLSNPVIWNRAESLFGLTETSNTYFIQGYSRDQYQLAFSINNTFGRPLPVNSILRVRYRDTIGEGGNSAYLFTPRGEVNGYTLSVQTTESARFGSERESIEQIRFNAPRYFQTQERAVVDQDWETIVRTQFPEVSAVVAYGGERTFPPQYGKVIISVKPTGRDAVATTSLKNRITNALKLKSLTTEPVIVDPEVYYIEVTSRVFYDRTAVQGQLSEVRSKVLNNILDLNNSTLNDFNKSLRVSKIISIIDSSDTSIVSNDTSTRIIRRFSPTFNAPTSLKFSWGNAIKSLAIPGVQEQPLGHAAMFDSSPFIITDNFGNDVECRLQDDGRGVIFMYTITSTGTFLVIRNNVGTIDYSTGEVNLNLTIKRYTGSYISLYGRTRSKDIIASQNKFLTIDSSDVFVSMREALK